MSDFWLLTARELSVPKILMQGMSFSEIARYEQRSSKTLHAIATRALMKLGLGTLSDFRLLYTGCGDSRVKRNIRYMQNISDNIPLIDSLSMCRTWYRNPLSRELPLVNQ